MNEHISERRGRGRREPGVESLRAPINHCNNRPISRYLQTREHVFAARTTQSVLTHLDSSTFARPLWAKNIKISFIAASLCVSLRRGPATAAVTLAPHRPTADCYVTFLFYSLSSGDSPRYVPVTSLSACVRCHLIYYLKHCDINSPLWISVIYVHIVLFALHWLCDECVSKFNVFDLLISEGLVIVYLSLYFDKSELRNLYCCQSPHLILCTRQAISGSLFRFSR